MLVTLSVAKHCQIKTLLGNTYCKWNYSQMLLWTAVSSTHSNVLLSSFSKPLFATKPQALMKIGQPVEHRHVTCNFHIVYLYFLKNLTLHFMKAHVNPCHKEWRHLLFFMELFRRALILRFLLLFLFCIAFCIFVVDLTKPNMCKATMFSKYKY